MLASGLPVPSSTVAVIAVDPPLNGTLVGSASTSTREAAAAPMAIWRAVSGAVAALVALALIVAVPEIVPARKVTAARPSAVSAVVAANDPSVVVKLTTVPFGAGRPLVSMISAVTSAVPLNGSWLADVVSVILVTAGGDVGSASLQPDAARQASAMAAAIDAVTRCDRAMADLVSCLRKSLVLGQLRWYVARHAEKTPE